MSDVGLMVAELIAAGCVPEVAAKVVATAFVMGASSVEFRGIPVDETAEKRRAFDRERKRKSAEIHRNSTGSAESEKPPLTYYPSLDKNLSEKKESKKERIPKKRDAPLPDDWMPSVRSYEIAEQNGVNVPIVEQIFRDYLKSSGKLYADYDAAFHNFLRNQRRFNGSSSHAKTENPRSGSLIAALDRALERSIAEDAAVAAPADTILSFPGRSVFRP